MKAKNLKLDLNPDVYTSEPLYDMIHGGYFPPEKLSTDPKTQEAIKNAYAIINTIHNHLEDCDLIS